jgi:hypothetical protein
MMSWILTILIPLNHKLAKIIVFFNGCITKSFFGIGIKMLINEESFMLDFIDRIQDAK